MEDSTVILHGDSINTHWEEDEDEFRSCCGEDEEVWKDTEQKPLKEKSKVGFDDEFVVKMFFKGISVAGFGESSSGFSGIGVFMERPTSFPSIQVQKKLDFSVEELVAEYLALMDGLIEATRNKIRQIHAYTDSQLLLDQITSGKKLENSLVAALRERILEHTSNLEVFSLKIVPSVDIEKPLKLAQLAIGFVSFHLKGKISLENCSICCEERPSFMMITLKCSHTFCSHCMRSYVDGKIHSSQVQHRKIHSSQVPIRCPELRCKYRISMVDCKSFLTSASYESLEKTCKEANVLHSDGIYCPFSNCSALLDPHKCLSMRATSSSQSDNSCIECLVCQRSICMDCEVPWHSSMSCEEYQSLPLEERDVMDIALHGQPQNERWRRCQQCRQMIERTQGCYNMTCCWCGHEFCYSCGTEYSDGHQTCHCTFWDEDVSEDLVTQSMQESEQWAWETFNSLPMVMDAYSDQERSQLALIQRFLAGGFGLSDHQPYQSPPRCTDSYVDTMKDLHQLPWLERFVSVISDDFYEDYIQ